MVRIIDVEKAKKNRKEFLAPYKEEFRKNKIKKERSKIKKERSKIEKKLLKIISELIAIEPSHLTEPWIIKEVVNWMRDCNYLYYLEKIFIKAPKKYFLTEIQEKNEVRGFFVVNNIERIITEEGVSVREACKKYVLQIEDYASKSGVEKYLRWDLTDENHDLEMAIRQVYQRAKKQQPERLLPWPYYGKDVEVDENGKFKIFGGR
jgi:hypothetical protein